MNDLKEFEELIINLVRASTEKDYYKMHVGTMALLKEISNLFRCLQDLEFKYKDGL